jgi:hypothetical protein
MSKVLDLYRYADDHGVDVDWFSLPVTPSLSVQLPDGSCAIAIDPWKMKTLSEETVCLAHELGHCETGSFYSQYTPFDVRRRHENRADKWAVQHLISAKDLDQAVAEGCTELWQLAERFGVTEAFMQKAVSYHTYGNVSSELYF